MNAPRLSILFFALLACVARAENPAPVPVRAGDTFWLSLSGVPDPHGPIDGAYTVDKEGTIPLPFIGRVKIAGLLPGQIQETIQNRYIDEKIFAHPVISVSAHKPEFVDILGAVNSHGLRLPYTSDLTLMVAIARAGGFTDYADKKKVGLAREGKRTVYNIPDFIKGRAEDPKLLPGDRIVIPQE